MENDGGTKNSFSSRNHKISNESTCTLYSHIRRQGTHTHTQFLSNFELIRLLYLNVHNINNPDTISNIADIMEIDVKWNFIWLTEIAQLKFSLTFSSF